MNKLIALFLLGAVTFFSYTASAAELKSATGTISKVQVLGENFYSYSTAGDAVVVIHMDELPLSCGSTFRRVVITSSHPAFQVAVSTALAAKAAGQIVELYYVEECTAWQNNAWDFSMIITK